MQKSLPKNLTSYDLLKALAVLLMIVDHAGFYFYPDEMWFRIVGRLCVPIWFFLIGYAKSREVPKSIWIGASVLVISSAISGHYILPLNILFTLAFTRMMIDGVMVRALRNYEAFAGMFFVLLFASFPSAAFVEYGALGVLFAMFGYLMRHADDLHVRFSAVLAFVCASSFLYIIIQCILLPAVSGVQFLVFCAGMFVVCLILFNFAPREYVKISRYAGPALPVMRLLGRRTLEIYVLHVVFFRGLAMWLYPDRFGFMDFRIVPASMLKFFVTFMNV